MTSKREIAAANETATLAKVVKPIIFARLDFASGVKRFHTEIGPLTVTHPIHGSELYTGIGDFGGIDGDMIETTTGAPEALSLSLTGIDSTLINDYITDDYFHRDVEIMMGLQDSSGSFVADPEILFSGFMDSVAISLQDGLGQAQLTCESRGLNLLRASDWRFTDEDKQVEVNGDLLGEYIYRMADLQLFWGDRSFVSPFITRTPGQRDRTRGRK